jgi:hypothetical protein
MAEFFGFLIILMLMARFFQKGNSEPSYISRRRERPSHPKPDIKIGTIK